MFEYDSDGNVIRHTARDKDMGENVTEYGYDKAGFVTEIKTGMGTENITYDGAGRISVRENLRTGISKTYTYCTDGNIRKTDTHRDGKLIYSEEFAYDSNGNKIYANENGNVKRYSYDGMNRLTGIWENENLRREYEFDGYNNISKEYEIYGAEISRKSYYYDNANRLILEDGAETVQYEYDNSGNLTKKITGIGADAQISRYAYDGYNRLLRYTDDYTVSEYEYNADGMRESKTVNGVKTRYVYDGDNISGEITEDRIINYYRGTELIGYTTNAGDMYYYRQNSHGDVTALVNEFGEEIRTYSYNAYGKENGFVLNPMGDRTILFQWKAETENYYNPFRYCGEYYDDETGLIYLRNRYYDNSIGRFITEDPVRDGLNWYAYCNGNPVMYVDLWGLYLTEE